MMGLFSKKKKEDENSSQQVAPEKLPDTVIDMLASRDPFAVQKQVPARDEHKKIPPEIIQERETAKSRIPLQETHYVSVSPNLEVTESDAEEPVAEKKHFTSPPLEHKHSFFAQLENFLKKRDKELNNYTSRDLVNKMKEYHDSRKTGHNFFVHEGDADNQILRKVDELRDLESDWVMRRKELDAAEMFLAEKELQIEYRFEELKRLMSSADKHGLFNRKCPPENVFVLSDGETLDSVQSLLYYLPKMTDKVFYYHVNERKNDFFDWIKQVFGSDELANAVLGSKNREEMMERLRKF